MKQVVQDLNKGIVETWELPDLHPQEGEVLIKSKCSLISTGTEKSLTDFGKSNWLKRIKNNPDKVKIVLDKAKKDGWASAIKAVQSKLSEPMQLGYSNVGVVVQSTEGFDAGDRVVSNGKHASMVSVPHNLVQKIPDNVSDEEAAFTVVGAIALQGIRLAKPALGETYVVYGLGLIGLIAVQLLAASGCKVIGVDNDASKLSLCEKAGGKFVLANENLVSEVINLSDGRGVDGVIICASAATDQIISNSANISRQRGKIVLIGVVGLHLNRSEFYEKELSFQVSCSYGPGRYDPTYEEGGIDYPYAYVRWTENRNFSAVLEMMSLKKLDVSDYVSSRFDVEEAQQAYENISLKDNIATILRYEKCTQPVSESIITKNRSIKRNNGANVGFIGAGNYAISTLIPAFKETNSNLYAVCSNKSISALNAAKKFSFSKSVATPEMILSNDDIDAVIITTRHNNHAEFILSALDNGKHVYVEKPLCLTLKELEMINEKYEKLDTDLSLTVGYNRRSSPHTNFIKSKIGPSNTTKHYSYSIMAGKLPSDHWTLDDTIGGGRFIGEGCHFLDLICYLENDYGPEISLSYGQKKNNDYSHWTVLLEFKSGATGVVNYITHGSTSLPKERLEVNWEDHSILMNNFRETKFYGRKVVTFKTKIQDKGQSEYVKSFIQEINRAEIKSDTRNVIKLMEKMLKVKNA